MDFYFDESLTANYKSNTQKIRVMSESWVEKNVFCPCCGNPHMERLKNNTPAGDFICGSCGENFELKSKKGSFGKKIADGAYDTMIERIKSTSNPNLFVMNYTGDFQVKDLMIIPKFFFVSNIIEKRKPLAPDARRAGWVGCNILYCDIPYQAKIGIIINQKEISKQTVLSEYENIKRLKTSDLNSRGWILDILNCVNNIPCEEFYLSDVYKFRDILQLRHKDNHNIDAKIRQQLQVLRDRGYIEFLGHGHYRKSTKRLKS